LREEGVANTDAIFGQIPIRRLLENKPLITPEERFVGQAESEANSVVK
jgi:hypothetical protein